MHRTLLRHQLLANHQPSTHYQSHQRTNAQRRDHTKHPHWRTSYPTPSTRSAQNTSVPQPWRHFLDLHWTIVRCRLSRSVHRHRSTRTTQRRHCPTWKTRCNHQWPLDTHRSRETTTNEHHRPQCIPKRACPIRPCFSLVASHLHLTEGPPRRIPSAYARNDTETTQSAYTEVRSYNQRTHGCQSQKPTLYENSPFPRRGEQALRRTLPRLLPHSTR